MIEDDIRANKPIAREELEKLRHLDLSELIIEYDADNYADLVDSKYHPHLHADSKVFNALTPQIDISLYDVWQVTKTERAYRAYVRRRIFNIIMALLILSIPTLGVVELVRYLYSCIVS